MASSLTVVDIDLETSLLIAQLTLDDISSIHESRKGKKRADAPLSDEEYALLLQSQILEDNLRVLQDHRIAKSFDRALASDASSLHIMSILEQAAVDDHQAALALSNGGALPEISRSQRSLEDRTLFAGTTEAEVSV